MAAKAALVDQIKSLQRSDPDLKTAWVDYCTQNLGGVRDPNLHNVGTLQAFLTMHGMGPSGGAPPPPPRSSGGWNSDGYGGGGGGGGGASWTPSWGGGHGGGGGGNYSAGGGGGGVQDAVGFIKTGQKSSQAFKAAWHNYCQTYGEGVKDPAKHEQSFIVSYIDWLGQLAEAQFGEAQFGGEIPPTPPPAPQWSRKRSPGPIPAASGAVPSAKRHAAEPYAPAEDEDTEKTTLVERVKALQRRSADTKQAWWNLCDEELGGVRDPNRHDKDTLLMFIGEHE